jgi:hypothetical protein
LLPRRAEADAVALKRLAGVSREVFDIGYGDDLYSVCSLLLKKGRALWALRPAKLDEN